MITSGELRRARDALQMIARMGLSSDARTEAAPVVRRLLRAIHNDDSVTLSSAIADLLDLAARQGNTRSYSRGTPRGGSPRSNGQRPPRGDRSSDGAQLEMTGLPAPDPDDLLAGIDEYAGSFDPVDVGITRTPHIDIDADEPVKPGETFHVVVYMDTTVPRAGETVEDFVVTNIRADEVSLDVDVWLTTSAHFVVDGSPIAVVTLTRSDASSTKADFTVAVRDPLPDGAGTPRLCARFDYRLRASGSVGREVAIDSDCVTVDGDEPTATARSGALLKSHATAPDLQISVVRRRGRQDEYDVKIATRLLGGLTVEDQWSFVGSSSDFVAATLAEFAAPSTTQRGRQTALRGAGITFFRSAPDEFKKLYWQLIDAQTPPHTVMVMSEEPSVPWELMIPHRRGSADLPPLGASCAVGRWQGNDYVAPDQWIPLQDSIVLAPDYETRKLPHATRERDLVLKMFPGHAAPATFDELDAFYGNHTASLLHFACHGEDATLQSIRLLKNQRLSAQQVLGGGLATACRQKLPLVFLNACQLGRPGAGLVAPEGFATSFIACDAGAVIAPLWEVDDEIAHKVAVSFYDAVARDPTTPFAEILRGIRARAYDEDGDDSYAAYCFYGDPNAAARQRE